MFFQVIYRGDLGKHQSLNIIADNFDIVEKKSTLLFGDKLVKIIWEREKNLVNETEDYSVQF